MIGTVPDPSDSLIARNLLLGLRPLREPVARPEAGKRGLPTKMTLSLKSALEA